MSYNNYNNPYAQYPYSANYGGYQPQAQYPQNYNYQQQVPQAQYPQNVQAQQQVQTNYLPLTFVNGIEGAKAFIVSPNQVIYLKDSDSDILFEKKADNQGKYELNAFRLTKIDINNVGKDTNANPISTDRFIMKEDLKGYATLDDFSKLEVKFDNALDRISRQIDRLNNRNSNPNVNKEKKDSE